CVENSEVFANTPGTGPYYVKPRTAGPTLKCSVRSEFSDPTRYQVQWQRYNKGDLRYVSIGDQLHDSTHFELIGDVSKGVYDLKLKDVSTDSVVGSYYCTVLDRQDTQSYQADPIEVIALVPPSDPVITESPTQAVTAGDSVTFKCSSSGGSPPPTISWTFLNGSTADERNVNTLLKGSTSESTLHFRVRSEDNGAYVVCTVTNKAIEFEQPKEARSPRLNVLFKPRVRVSPDQDLAIEAGHHVDLVCDADSNPYPPSYEWRHLALGEVYAASKWTVIASRNMSGDFECRAANSVGEGSAILTLNVQYAPVVVTKSRYNPREGERVQIECSVDANPQAVDVKWSGPQGFISDGPLLVLKSVSREQTGNYTCTATNYLSIYGETGSQTRTGSATTIVDVQRPPGHADISPPRLNVVVGGTITLTCSTHDPGSPAGNFKWASPSSGGLFGTREHDHAQLTVRMLSWPTMDAIAVEPTMYMVIEPAWISRHLTKERILKLDHPAGGLECEAKGFPAPSFQWFKDGEPIDTKRYTIESVIVKSSCSSGDYCSQTVTSTLIFSKPLKWADKGNYSCRATNGADQKTVDNTSWTVMRVNHGPVVLNQRFPEEGLAAADIGTMAQLRCIISARPEPKSVIWVYNSLPIEENGRYSFQVIQHYNRDEYEHVLQISDTTESDYGPYMCRVANGMDKAEVIIKLTRTGPPQVPTNLRKLSATPNSLSLGWVPGFDGGFEQTFIVEYRNVNPFTETFGKEDVSTVEVKNTSRVENIEDDGTASWYLSFNLTGLNPLSSYYLRLRAKNKKPRPPPDDCTLLYVSSGDTWRSAGCFSPDQVISDLVGGAFFRARFCSREHVLSCSKMSHILEASSIGSPWRLALVIPAAVLALLVIIICVLLVFCCRTRSPSKGTKKRVREFPVMPQMETKNTAVHGSQADSGVFIWTRISSNRLYLPTITQVMRPLPKIGRTNRAISRVTTIRTTPSTGYSMVMNKITRMLVPVWMMKMDAV
ncbi:immunoglobulin domain protein, partial [Ostertagia ostertagi]